MGARLPAERRLGDHRAVCKEGGGELGVLGRIDAVLSAGQHRDRAAGEARAVRGAVDAAGEAGGDDEAGFAELARDPLSELDAGG